MISDVRLASATMARSGVLPTDAPPRLHSMPDRRRVSRRDRLSQKAWALRASVLLRIRGRL